MPSVSKKQHNLMAAVANNPAIAKKAHIPQSVGKEFLKADKGKTFNGGGMAESKKMVGKEIAFMKKKGAPKSMVKHEESEMSGMKKGGKAKSNPFMEMIAKKKAMAGKPMKKMASGGLAGGHKSADGVASKGKTKAKQITMKKGGYC